jgi:hypothetical protein
MGPHPSTARRHRLTVKTFADLKSVTAKQPPAAPAPAKRDGASIAPMTHRLDTPTSKPVGKPASLSSKQRKRIAARIAASEWLRQTYPVLFSWPPRPLAIGIGKAIAEAGQAAGVKRAHVHAAMRFHVRSRRYVDALAADGAMRFHLDGTPAEPVGEGDRAEARRVLAERTRPRE